MTWELVGAVVGAGLASGREIATFFSRYGYWGYVGIAVSGLTLGILGTIHHPIQWKSRWLKWLWDFLLTAMLIVTGGAMLSGAGEIAEMILPFKGACWVGQLVTLALSWVLASRSVSGFARVCKLMMFALGGMILTVLFSPQQKASAISSVNPPESLLRGIMYGGFNAALQVPILTQMRFHPRNMKYVWRASIVCCSLLALGNTVILRHPLLLTEPMPFLAAVRSWGSIGYWLYAFCLYLAVLSTMTACMKGLRSRLAILVVILVAQLGFTGVVDALYPILGTGCFFMLVWAKFSKSGSDSFHSTDDVI